MYRRPAVTGWILFAASGAYLLSFSSYGINLWDEGGLYQGGLRYMAGQTVYEDFHGYTPGRYYLVEAAFRLFGTAMLPVRYLFAVGTGLFVLFTFHICRRIMPPVYTAAAILLAASAPAVYYQRFYGLAFLFTMWAVAVFLENRRNFHWLLIAAAYTYLFKNEVLLVTGPVYAYLVWEQLSGKMRRWFGAALAAMTAVAVHQSGLIDIVRTRLPFFYSQWSNPFPIPWKGYQGVEFGLVAFGENLLFYLPVITAASLAVMAIKGRDAGNPTDEAKLKLLFILAYLQLAAMSLVIMRAGFDNLIRCLPLFFIAACYLAYRIVNRLKRPAWRRTAAQAALGAMLLFYLIDFNYINGYYVGSIGAVRDADAKFEGGRVEGIRVHHTDAAIISEVTKWIDEQTKPGDPILALPLNPIWYYLTGRTNPTYYDWVLPATLTGPDDEKKLVAQLSENPPVLAVIVDLEIDNNPRRRLENYAPLLTQWIVSNYSYNGRVAYFQIWKKNDAP